MDRPSKGGRWVRDPETGKIDRAEPVPALALAAAKAPRASRRVAETFSDDAAAGEV